jgi:hypothetical protein
MFFAVFGSANAVNSSNHSLAGLWKKLRAPILSWMILSLAPRGATVANRSAKNTANE